MKSGIVFGAIGVGFALLILSGLWQTLFPPTRSWTPEKAARISEVKARLNHLTFTFNNPQSSLDKGEDLGALKAEGESLVKEFEQLTVDFNTAMGQPRTVAAALKWTGISLASIGLIGWYAIKHSS